MLSPACIHFGLTTRGFLNNFFVIVLLKVFCSCLDFTLVTKLRDDSAGGEGVRFTCIDNLCGLGRIQKSRHHAKYSIFATMITFHFCAMLMLMMFLTTYFLAATLQAKKWAPMLATRFPRVGVVWDFLLFLAHSVFSWEEFFFGKFLMVRNIEHSLTQTVRQPLFCQRIVALLKTGPVLCLLGMSH